MRKSRPVIRKSCPNPKVAQTLARHSDIRLTLDRYAHVFSEQQIEAINSLPDLSGGSKAHGA